MNNKNYNDPPGTVFNIEQLLDYGRLLGIASDQKKQTSDTSDLMP